jgi:hypothetical protein
MFLVSNAKNAGKSFYVINGVNNTASNKHIWVILKKFPAI